MCFLLPTLLNLTFLFGSEGVRSNGQTVWAYAPYPIDHNSVVAVDHTVDQSQKEADWMLHHKQTIRHCCIHYNIADRRQKFLKELESRCWEVDNRFSVTAVDAPDMMPDSALENRLLAKRHMHNDTLSNILSVLYFSDVSWSWSEPCLIPYLFCFVNMNFHYANTPENGRVSRAKMQIDWKSIARDWIAEREGARLPYSTLTG